MKTNKNVIKGDEKHTIDWDGILERLNVNHELLKSGWATDAETTRQILEDRAYELAKEPVLIADQNDGIVVVEFLLAQEKYAFELSFIREILPLKNVTNIPCTPVFVVGIINVRGQMISVLDLKPLFELVDQTVTATHQVILLHHEAMVFGILADNISGTQQINRRELQESLPTLNGVRALYLKGITTDGVVVLDAKRLLTDKNIWVHDQF